ncbi:phosphate ABC transporter permease PstA [Corynebacterium jeikeium]|uniref:Phosphate transport system permease protein PstA n=1 Tax=Corynebacterium jeikeium (strain K411) TaxID=306537 RepID=Q4JXC6_CORJK|nr:phosphate ABC transporter permease PstA [Corynebacterium jeikeium]EEW16787.1 phosphate ABC transporter, permease protein PstA [Corynebacterium jeikeium ATCC 43734]OOD31334.1 phosphate ABC transporter, permease protein PstA [Corynebacterium jeikeium]WCZ52932.1 Phosphate transport system permease protein PstA [Corynebacterium jeikeium]CAI36531.1 phosphate ABC transport system, permease protein [Corynebacterium jeikeium K411]SCX04383.1 Phosphate transport system permease protein PstA [Coryneba
MTDAATVENKKSSSSSELFTQISGKRKAVDKFATVIIYFAMALALVPLLWVLFKVLSEGLPAVLNPDWWMFDMVGQPRNKAGGGAVHAIIGTLMQVLVTSALSIPIGVFTAIYLVEYSRGGFLGRITTFMVDILTGVPSIVAALFVYAMWITMFGFERSGFAVSLALVLLMVPIIVRNAEEMLRVVPMDLREASYALGVPKWKTIVKIVLPTALSGIVTGIMLAVARVMGESAPVLILVGSTTKINWNPFEGGQQSLPLYMVDLYGAGSNEFVLERLWGSALTLVLLVAILMIGARLISKRYSVKV